MVCCYFMFFKTFLSHHLKDCNLLVAEPAKVLQISFIMRGGKIWFTPKQNSLTDGKAYQYSYNK